FRPGPVLGREGKGGHPSDAELQRSLDGVEQRLLPSQVAGGARQAAGVGPAPIPVENQADMARHRIEVDPAQVERHSSTAREARERSRWYSTKRRATPMASPERSARVGGNSAKSARSRDAM